jgi:hypothetical protein
MTRPRDIADSINRIDSSAADATAVTIDANENVGVGTTSPDGLAHVYNGMLQVGSKTGDTSIQQNANAIRIAAVPNSSTEWGGLQWYREFSDVIGAEIIASRSSSTETDTDLIFKTSTNSSNAVEVARITHAGNVGIGTSPANKLDILSTGAVVARFKRDNTGGASGGISVGNNDKLFTFYVDNSGGLQFYEDSTERIRFQLGGGISFNGDTAAANALDDYEEGTWTAGLKATVTNPTVNSITNSTGVYTKIGDLVFIQIYTGAINISNGGSGAAYIDGLPFSPSDSPTSAVQYSVITFTHTTALTGQIQNGYVHGVYSGFFPILEGATNGTTWTTGATLYLMASGVYRTDA